MLCCSPNMQFRRALGRGLPPAPSNNPVARSGRKPDSTSPSSTRVGRVSPAPALQAPAGRWNAAASSTAKHQHDLSGMRPGLRGKSPNPSAVCLSGMRFSRKCRSCRRDQHSKGGIRPVGLSSELRSKRSVAGTHRKGGVAALVGISFLQGGCQNGAFSGV